MGLNSVSGDGKTSHTLGFTSVSGDGETSPTLGFTSVFGDEETTLDEALDASKSEFVKHFPFGMNLLEKMEKA